VLDGPADDDDDDDDDDDAAVDHAAIAAIFQEMLLANRYPCSHCIAYRLLRILARSCHNHELSSRMPLAPERAAEALRYVQAGQQPVVSFWQRMAHNLLQAQLELWAIARAIRDGATADPGVPRHLVDISRYCDVTERTAFNMVQGAEHQTALVGRFGIGVACIPPARLGMGYVCARWGCLFTVC
jgi:poly(3-hydroxybutyrate) depolymerase